MSGLSTAPAVWYLMRATGVVALILLTLVVVLGIATNKRWHPTGLPRFVTVALHRNASLLAVCFLGVHIATALVDPDAGVSLAAVVTPLLAARSPLFVGLGALSFDLLLALLLTSLIRGRLGRRLWRSIHLGAYLSWPLALVHGLGVGSDAARLWFLAAALAAGVAFAAAFAWRIGSTQAEGKHLGTPRSDAALPSERTLGEAPA